MDTPVNQSTNPTLGAELICVGTELLLGDILNSNAQYLAKQLANLGIPHYFQTVVGDNPERLIQAVTIASSRSQLIIMTGGLGPTPDDLTTETVAQAFETPLVEHAEVLADITQKFAVRNRPMSPSNHKQALLPQGADVLPNPTGTAPGMIWQPRPGLTILTFPGVPSEMKRMWQDTAIPYLLNQGWGQTIIHSHSLRFWGIGESTLAEKVSAWLALTNPTVAPYAGNGEVRLRVSAQASSVSAAEAIMAPIISQLKTIAGLDYYGTDDETLASVVGHSLHTRGETLAVAESCTGGGLGQMLTQVSGSSAYFWGGVISYDNRVKVDLLDVDPEVLANQGAVSHEVAQQMALGVRSRLNTDWGVSITGIAGPGGGSDTKPVGLVYIGLAYPNGQVTSCENQFGAMRGRDWIRHLSSCTALDQLRRALASG